MSWLVILWHSVKGHLLGPEIRISRALTWHEDLCLGRGLYWSMRALIWLTIWLLLLIEVASQANPLEVLPSTVSVGSCLPLQNTANNIGLGSPNGMFNLLIHAWRDSPASYCMAGIVNVKINPGSMLWGANNAQPLKVSSTCRLFLSPEGDLLLQYDGNNTAWQTHTAGMGASNLTLQDSGNLVLHTKDGRIVWQSFTQSLSFALNSGMNLTSTMTIYSSAPIPNGVTSFSVPGSFGMQLHNHSHLVLFTNFKGSSRYVYWSFPLTNSSTEQVSYVALDDAFTFFDSSSQALGSIAPTSAFPSDASSALRVAVLDPPSANLLAFYRDNNTHTWVAFYNSTIGVCDNPMHCGHFTLCNTSTGACTCPPGFLKNSAGDCQPESDRSFPSPSCSSAAFGSVDASAYFFVPVSVSFPPQLCALFSDSVKNCTSLCADSCVCRAALFDPGTSSCSLFLDLPTLPSRADSKQLMLLKIVTRQQSTNKLLAPILSAVCAAIAVSLCLICATAAICCFKKRRKRNPGSRGQHDDEGFLMALPRLPPRYTYKELEAATKDFSIKLGAGGFGAVYEGVLPSGMKIAVKKLEEGSGQSLVQFRAEVASIGSVSHVNLVILKGFCHEGNRRLLVYEYMVMGSLDRWLFKGGAKEGKTLGWERRCKIALDTAKGLAYLHHECVERIVHCDVKPENILLDEEFNAKVGDFGLAKLVGHDRHSFAMTSVKGTRGYLAPEWLQDATITAKSDVYSFGIVLLELISGRRCLDSDYGYLPTLAFRIVSVSSSRLARANNSQEGNRGLVCPPPQLIQSSQTSCKTLLGCDERVSRSEEHQIALPAAPLPPKTAPDHIASQTISSSNPLPQLAHAFDHSSMAALLDPCLSSDIDLLPTNLERMIFIGLWCVQPNPATRPGMSVVVQMMEGIVDVPPPPLHNPLWDTQEVYTFASTSSSISQPSALFFYQSSTQESQAM